MEGRARTVVSDQLSQFTGQSKNSRLWVRSRHRPGQTSAAAPSTRYFLYLAFHKSGQLTNLTSWSLLRFCFILSLQPVSPTSHSHTALFNLGSRNQNSASSPLPGSLWVLWERCKYRVFCFYFFHADLLSFACSVTV